jgi:hypothetical protein
VAHEDVTPLMRGAKESISGTRRQTINALCSGLCLFDPCRRIGLRMIFGERVAFTFQRHKRHAPATAALNTFDINQSGALNPLDVLVLIDEINRGGSRVLDPVLDVGLLFVDPNRDGALDPLDVLFVIDEINRR